MFKQETNFTTLRGVEQIVSSAFEDCYTKLNILLISRKMSPKIQYLKKFLSYWHYTKFVAIMGLQQIIASAFEDCYT